MLAGLASLAAFTIHSSLLASDVSGSLTSTVAPSCFDCWQGAKFATDIGGIAIDNKSIVSGSVTPVLSLPYGATDSIRHTCIDGAIADHATLSIGDSLVLGAIGGATPVTLGGIRLVESAVPSRATTKPTLIGNSGMLVISERARAHTKRPSFSHDGMITRRHSWSKILAGFRGRQ